MVQVVHELDVLRAIELSLQKGKRGVYNIRGPGELPLSKAFQRLGKRPMFWPEGVAQRAINSLWHSRLVNFPAPEIDHIRYLCMVDDSKARRELGYRHDSDMERTLAVGRRRVVSRSSRGASTRVLEHVLGRAA
jgi:UDP-glucose 4-epimerase